MKTQYIITVVGQDEKWTAWIYQGNDLKNPDKGVMLHGHSPKDAVMKAMYKLESTDHITEES